MKHILAILLLCISIIHSYAQISYPISTYTPTPDVFRALTLTNQQIEDNDTINERIVDLVSPMVTDSILGKKKAHHRLFLVGWMIHLAGYGWRPVETVKQKYVGTVRRESRSGKDHFTEYDICFDLYFHTSQYLGKTFKAYDRMGQIHKQDFVSTILHHHHHKQVYTGEPYQRDTAHVDMNKYRLHCELTPGRPYRTMLNELFYPVQDGADLSQHPNFMAPHPTMGFYGASCLDCNHDCHPEIHPYEWIWWMNLHNGTVKDKTWILGIFKEKSNRFPTWSDNPKTGKANVPFAFEVKDKAAGVRTITVEHLVFDKFIDSNMTLLSMPATVISPDQHSVTVALTDAQGGSIPVKVIFTNPILTGGLRYWFSDVNWDEQSHLLSGYFYVGTSAHDLYTLRVTVAGE